MNKKNTAAEAAKTRIKTIFNNDASEPEYIKSKWLRKPVTKKFIAITLSILVFAGIMLGVSVTHIAVANHHQQTKNKTIHELSVLEKVRERVFMREHNKILKEIDDNVDEVTTEMEEIQKKVSAGIPVIGITVQNSSQGLNVLEIKGKKAKKSGIMIDDVILSFNDVPVKSSSELSDLIRECNVGDIAKLEVNRRGQRIEIELELSSSHEI